MIAVGFQYFHFKKVNQPLRERADVSSFEPDWLAFTAWFKKRVLIIGKHLSIG